MKSNKNRLVAVLPFLTAGMMLLPGTGCDDDSLSPPGLCCDEFEIGADLSGASFAGNADFAGFMQATADLGGVAQVMAEDVLGACKAIAVDLGSEETAVTETDRGAAAKAWCALAIANIKTTLNVTADLKGVLSISVQEPVCTVNASAQANCEAKCDVNISAECKAELGSVEARCDPGELSVKCEGGCSGSCQGSANLAVKCEGECSGTCEGGCSGTCEVKDSQGNCKGECKGGTCTGECRGSCKMEANANVECNGECKGGCEGTATAPKCQAELKEPSAECKGNASADCSGNCNASASVKAECKPPSVEITAAASLNAAAAAKVVSTLKLNLPKIALVFKRTDVLTASIGAVFTAGGNIDPGSLDGSAVLCLPKAIEAITAAQANITGAVEGSASIGGELL